MKIKLQQLGSEDANTYRSLYRGYREQKVSRASAREYIAWLRGYDQGKYGA